MVRNRHSLGDPDSRLDVLNQLACSHQLAVIVVYVILLAGDLRQPLSSLQAFDLGRQLMLGGNQQL